MNQRMDDEWMMNDGDWLDDKWITPRRVNLVQAQVGPRSVNQKHVCVENRTMKTDRIEQSVLQSGSKSDKTYSCNITCIITCILTCRLTCSLTCRLKCRTICRLTCRNKSIKDLVCLSNCSINPKHLNVFYLSGLLGCCVELLSCCVELLCCWVELLSCCVELLCCWVAGEGRRCRSSSFTLGLSEQDKVCHEPICVCLYRYEAIGSSNPVVVSRFLNTCSSSAEQTHLEYLVKASLRSPNGSR